MPQPLPPDFRLALDESVRRPRPEVLVGGYPVRVLRLRPAGVARVDGWARGEPIGGARGARALARRLLDSGLAHPRPPAGAGPTPGDVTVVIPVRERPDGLAQTLAALGGRTRVIVVDDGSSPPATAPGAVVIRHDHPRGPAAARNTGWRAAGSPLVAFVDADCQPTPGWLAPLLAHFADPAVGAAAPRILSRGTSGTPAALSNYELQRSALDLGAREAPVRPGSPVPYVPTAALALRRRALLDVGGFDDGLRYGEDVDLVWRLGERGWRVRYEPAAIVTHPARTGYRAWAWQRIQYGRSAAPLAARHGRAVAPVAISVWSAGAWGLAATGRPLAGVGLALATSAVLGGRAGSDPSTATTLAQLAVTGNVRAGDALAGAIRRAWLPPAGLAAVAGWRRGRPALAVAVGAALIVPPLIEWVRVRPSGLNPVSWAVLRLADDLSYQAGLWAGVIETRSAAALLPDW